ncbi:MAG: DUF3365 domain-containing protein [Weeksellaceae bacterium]|nr:DUF3365 domain-containing protein [Weeksellaceae bacterium]
MARAITLFGILCILFSCNPEKTGDATQDNAMAEQQNLYPVDSIRQYILRAQLALAEELKEAVDRQGSAFAVDFCNVRALELTDSLGHSHNIDLQRITDKPRNPQNRANMQEQALMDSVRELMAQKDFKPELIEHGNSYYYPIITNSLCLQCHGKPNQITEFTNEVILELYTQDEARGYALNELRGFFKVTTPESQP